MTEDAFAERLRGQPLGHLRALRESLQEEERQVSYWRQLVQGRLDLVRTGLEGGRPAPGDLARLAGGGRSPARRRSPAWTLVGPDGGPGPVPGLGPLWDTPVPWNHLAELAEVERGLAEAEVELSAYRRVLHQRIDACTVELVGRYVRDPSQLGVLARPG
jgi:hypothetical protein